MLARLAREAENGIPEEKFHATWKIFFLIFGVEAVALAASALCAVGVAGLFKDEVYGMVSVFAFIPAYTILFLRLLKDGSPLSNFLGRVFAWISEKRAISKRTERRYSMMPHFGRMFKLSQVMDILNNEEFVPYSKDKDNKIPWVKVSTDDTEKIEEQAKIAYEDYDVMKLGGLLFLSKELGYEIKYVKKLKEEAKVKGETVPGFDFDAETAFGDDEVQRFSLGAYMYQKK